MSANQTARAPHESWRLRFYRTLVRALGSPDGRLIRRFFSEERRHSWNGLVSDPALARAPGGNAPVRVWFHAASEGELEVLWEIILSWARGEAPGGASGAEIIVTVFSESAGRRVKTLAEEFSREAGTGGARLIYAGYSPWEGRWRAALEHLRPDAFVTVKYEAWPELWFSLSALSIPLVVFDARARSSLRAIQRAGRVLGARLPELAFGLSLPREAGALRRIFPRARIEQTGYARWERVFRRAERGNARARELMEALAALPRPWGVLGSAWLPDLALWTDLLPKVRGTVWIVPHKVDAESVGAMELTLRGAGIEPLRTSQSARPEAAAVPRTPAGGAFVLVDEMGFLSELYAGADWSHVGGGFSGGVHSTIEPAIHGLPLCAGPKGMEKFSETVELMETGQLEIVRNEVDLRMWAERFVPEILPADEGGGAPAGVGVWRREEWKAKALARRGSIAASSRLIADMLEPRALACKVGASPQQG